MPVPKTRLKRPQLPPGLSGYLILAMIAALKTVKEKTDANKYWRWYFMLRQGFYRSYEWRTLKVAGPKVCSRSPEHNGRIDRHHKKRIYDYPELGLEPSNIEYLCRRCHRREH